LLISPGGTVFTIWVGENGLHNPVPEESLPFCDGRKAFEFNERECPDYLEEYDCGVFGVDPPCPEPRPCPYYYLVYDLTSVYLSARQPDGSWGAVETVSITDPDSLTNHLDFDAAVGPDGSIHVLWLQSVPNVPLDPAPWSMTLSNPASVPVPGLEAFYNRCGFDFSGDQQFTELDLRSWIVGLDDSTCTAGCGAPCDSIVDSLSACDSVSFRYPCWRQLGSIVRLNYRRRYPDGHWSPVHYSVAEWTDPGNPDTLRTCRAPAIAVDSQGWVHAIWAQKSPTFPSCAWRGNDRRQGPGGLQSKGFFNDDMYDAFYRRWPSFDSQTQDGPTPDDPIIRLTNDTPNDVLPTKMPALQVQDNSPSFLIVEGSGEGATAHMTLCRCPTHPPVDPGPDRDSLLYVNDNQLYMRVDGGVPWTNGIVEISRPNAKRISEEDECPAELLQAGGTSMNTARLLLDNAGNVHAFIEHQFQWHDTTGTCDPSNEICPHDSTCIRAFGLEIMHRVLGSGDPSEWSPPYPEAPNRPSAFTPDTPRAIGDRTPATVLDATGCLHTFWSTWPWNNAGGHGPPAHDSTMSNLEDSCYVYHSALVAGQWTEPDRVVSVPTYIDQSATPPTAFGIGNVAAVEKSGIFHLTYSAHPEASTALSRLHYLRGVLVPNDPDTVICSNLPEADGAIVWSDTVTLCEDFLVEACDTLIIEAGTVVLVDTVDASRSGADSSRVELIVEGRLQIDGTSWNPGEFVTFRSVRSPERATYGDWYGIRLVGGSARTRMKYARVSGGLYGLRDIQGSGTKRTPQDCASADTNLPPSTDWIENCVFAYNALGGVSIRGDTLQLTPDRVHVVNNEFLANLEGLRLENVSAPDSARLYAIRGNRFKFNDLYGLNVVGTFGRKIVVDSNLVWGLGPDEYLPNIDSTSTAIDIGIHYSEAATGPTGDTLVVKRNTLYRIQGSGLCFDLPGDIPPGAGSLVGLVGDEESEELEVDGNLFYMTGTCIEFFSSKYSLVRGNRFFRYTTGVVTTNTRPDLGGGRRCPGCAGNNDFLAEGIGYWEATPDSFRFHLVGPSVSTDTLFATSNFWAPIVHAPSDWAACTTDSFFFGNLDSIAIAPCRLPRISPILDYWGVLHLPLKRPAAEGLGEAKPRSFTLFPNRPNPFPLATSIAFEVPLRQESVELTVYDVQGRRVKTLHTGPMEAGRFSLMWAGQNDRGESVASGVYFYRLSTDRFDQTQRMVLMR